MNGADIVIYNTDNMSGGMCNCVFDGVDCVCGVVSGSAAILDG